MCKSQPCFCGNLCFFAGEHFAVLVWLDIVALGRYTVFIAAGSCEGVGAPNLVFIGLNCASGGARTVWGSCAFLVLGGICMKTLYFDCGMGAAGDMLSAALLDVPAQAAQPEQGHWEYK